jgi:hypothetical protein
LDFSSSILMIFLVAIVTSFITRVQALELTRQLHFPEPPRALPTAWNAGFFEIGWINKDFTKGEVQQRQRARCPTLKGFRSKPFSSVLAGSVTGSFLRHLG